MGKQKHCKEIMNWARKKRRMIRREDLLAYLAGKPPPPRPHPHRFAFFIVYFQCIIKLDYCPYWHYFIKLTSKWIMWLLFKPIWRNVTEVHLSLVWWCAVLHRRIVKRQVWLLLQHYQQAVIQTLSYILLGKPLHYLVYYFLSFNLI